MFMIIAGCGKLGAGLARVLSSEGHDIVVVAEEIDPKRLGGEFDGVTVSGSPTDEDVLESAGMRRADMFVAATADDAVNAMAVQMAKELFRVPLSLARIADPAMESFYRELGIETVCPTTASIERILHVIERKQA
jgi:trk system potassium uptake protein TrkA